MISPHNFNTAFHRVESLMENDMIETKWQVGWDDENIPAFGLEFFDSEIEAQRHAESLSRNGETGITLTEFADGCPLVSWKLINDHWE